MDFTHTYKPGGIIFLLLLLLLLLSTTTTTVSATDNVTMFTLLSTITPTPSGWSSTTNFCNWHGIKCNTKHKVISINLASHSLYGTLPSFTNLSRLRKLNLYNNSFTSIPNGAFSSLTNLRILRLSNNFNLTPWRFPSELVGSHKLTAFYASNANLMGSIPDIFSSFPRLVNLTLSYNNFTGTLPVSLNRSGIRKLKLDNQKSGLTGNISALIGMNNLSLVWLQGNRFTGVIPMSFVSLPNLCNVRLEKNEFQRPIPHFVRKRKVYIRMSVSNNTNTNTNAPSEDYSNGKKTNVGAVVGYTFVLVFILLGFIAWMRCLRRRHRQRVTSQQQVNENRGIVMEVKVPQDIVVRVELPDEGKQQRPQKERGRVEDGKKDGSGQLGRQGNQQPPHKNGVVGQRDKQGNQQPPHKEGLGRRGDQHPPRKEGVVGQRDKQGNQQLPHKEGVVGQRDKQGNQQPQKEEGTVKPKDRVNKVEKQPQLVEEQGSISFVLPKKYPYDYIKIITNYFDPINVIGEGGFARVYKGTLLNGTIVAVKWLKQNHGSKINDFKNEVEALGRTSHFNLVKLIGYCAEDYHRLLVYEYMNNGTLEEWIFGTKPEKSLSWHEKKNIILGIVQGLVYLHENCDKKILYRDLKPSNVLLDEKKNAKLCDFGISKLLERDQSSTSTACWGSRGYAAPEVVKGKRISEKVDVYSFGIVVLEVMFGKKYDHIVSSNQTNLEAGQLPGLIMNLGDEMRKNGKDIERIGKLAVLCLGQNPEDRPKMSDILSAIKGGGHKNK